MNFVYAIYKIYPEENEKVTVCICSNEEKIE